MNVPVASVAAEVDPVFVRDQQAIRQLKLAFQADIRIIDGVWYFNTGDGSFPGLAIYSDHPGEGIRPKVAGCRPETR